MVQCVLELVLNLKLDSRFRALSTILEGKHTKKRKGELLCKPGWCRPSGQTSCTGKMRRPEVHAD
jgi:hypothetical protein